MLMQIPFSVMAFRSVVPSGIAAGHELQLCLHFGIFQPHSGSYRTGLGNNQHGCYRFFLALCQFAALKFIHNRWPMLHQI
jgi:hypothetical protein